MYLGLESKITTVWYLYVMSVLRKISLLHPTRFPLPTAESSAAVTFGVTGVLSDAVN